MAKEDEQASELHAASERAFDWLEEQWKDGKPCPYCKGNQWGVSPSARQFVTEGESADPMYMVTCRGCGNTVLIDSRFVPELPADSSR